MELPEPVVAPAKLRKLRFNCYLVREGVRSPELAMRSAYRANGKRAMTPLAPSGSAPAGTLGYFSEPAGNQPPWARTLSAIFPELAQAVNLSNRFVILLPVNQRWFAVCFGYGSSTLEWSNIEANFGLRFAARRMSPDAIRELRSRRIGDTNRTQSVQLPSGGGIGDFEVALDGEFVRRLAGTLDNEGIAFSDIDAIAATDAISFRAQADLRQIQTTLKKMLDEVDSRTAIEALEFVDCLEPLRSNSEQVRDLDDLLAARLFGNLPGYAPPRREVLSPDFAQYIFDFSLPDIDNSEEIDSINLYRNNKKYELSDMSIGSIREALASQKGRLNAATLNSVKLMAFDSNGDPKSPMLTLRNWLIFEAGDSTTRYILTLGRWFGLAEKFTDKLDRDLRKIADLTGELGLPRWPKSWDEGKYNKDGIFEPSKAQYALFDKLRLLSSDGDMIETCDVFHEDGHLVHVKKYRGASEMSHLLSQGAVSAAHLVGDDDYKATFVAKVHELNDQLLDAARRAPKSVVYAIAVADDRSIPLGLPSFSKVNLRDFAKRIRNTGARPAVCRIQIS